ncbi:MAG: helix-turn-helix domain-containing protein [Lachnospiraceae bacterium]
MHYLDLNEQKQHGTEDFPVEYYYVDPSHPQYHMPYHWHMEYEMIRIRKGTFLISLDQKEITACEGDILFIHDGVLHAGTPKDCIYECLVFDLNTLKKVSNVCQTILRQITLHEIYVFEHIRKGTSGAMDGPVDTLFETMHKKNPGYELATYGYLFLVFSAIFSDHLYLKPDHQTPRNYRRILQLKQVLELIESSYSRDLSLEELSRAAGMSPKYFCRFFHEMTHRTPIDYLNHYRIECASHLLQNTELSLLDVADAVGFHDLSYFIKTFKKYKGITPKKYGQLP